MPISFNKLVLGGGSGGGMNVGKLPIDLTTPTPSPTATEAPTPTPTASPAPTPNPTTTAGVVSGRSLWAAGYNNSGELGINNVIHRSSPIAVGNEGTWASLAKTSGFNLHNGAIKQDGSLWMWGANASGQLGHNSLGNKSSPVQVISGVSNWMQVAAGISFTCAIDSENKLWTWGTGTGGRLGSNSTMHRSSPAMIMNNIKFVSCTVSAAAAIDLNNKLWVWGQNLNGQFGLNNEVHISSPVQVSNINVKWVAFGADNLTSAMAVIREDNTLWLSGQNSSGQLGDGTVIPRSSPVQEITNSKWQKVYGKLNGFTGHKETADLWSWGNNAGGSHGINSQSNTSSPVQELTRSIWYKVYGFYLNTFGIKFDNTLWGWGSNVFGQLQNNSVIARSSPVQINTGGYTVTDFSGTGYQYGNSLTIREYPLLTPQMTPTATPVPTTTAPTATPTPSPSATPLPTPSPTPDASFPAGNSLAYITNDRVVSKQPIMYSLSGSMSKLDGPSNDEGTSNNSFFIIDNGSFNAYGFGTNDRGQLGDLSIVDRPASSPSQVVFGSWKQISVGTARTVAGIQNAAGSGMPQKLYVWGSGGSALAQGSASFQSGNRSSPIFTCMGDDESWAKVVMGAWSPGTNGAIQDSTGNGSGTLWMWGGNYYGSLGVDDTVHRSSQIQVMTGGTWLDLAIGSGHVLAVKDNGSLWSWGKNTNGQLGHNTAIGVAQSGCSSPVQIGTDIDWYQVFAGENTSFATKSDGRLFAWGANSYGVLGINNTVHRSSPVQVGTATNWSKIALAGFITYGLKTDGSLWSWGGQSHDGSTFTNSLSSPVQVSGVTNNGKYIDITTRGRITGSTIETYAIWQQLN